jgi:histidine triad (HIT) family protein
VRPGYSAAVSDCLFCAIVTGQVPSKVVLETEHCYAFRDINPVAPVHTLVVPKEHVASIATLGPAHGELLSHLFAAVSQVAEQEGVAQSGFRVVANVGADAGQTVDHLHLHVIGGQAIGWPPFPGHKRE